MTDIEKMDLRSMDIVEEKREKLKELFPEVFTEGQKIDFERLKLALGESVDVGKERYGMNWPGKADCFKIIQQPSIATLTPAREESIDFDESENLFIEGDNLEVLKLLQKSYLGKVKVIEIDPPYNTGNDFIYPDNYTENLDTYLRYTGQIDDEGRKYSTNTEADGRFHSKWLNMMYPRLFLARNLLREDGVIFIHIDDHEIDNLRKMCDEIFGEENFIECISWKNKYGAGAKTKGFISVHEYIVCYSKRPIENVEAELSEEEIAKYTGKDEKFSKRGGFITQPLMTTSLDARINLQYTIEYAGHVIEPRKQWVWSKERLLQAIKDDEVVFNKQNDGTFSVRAKQYLKNLDGSIRKGKPLSLLNGPFNQEGTKELNELGMENLFDFPKPTSLIKYFASFVINNINDKNGIYLDFFSGSCTSAQALLELNKEDEGNRKFIMVQLPEPCAPESEAFKAGYKTIADIGKERIRRVIKQIKEEQEQKKDLFTDDKPKQDLGFKVFKLKPSNFKLWNDQVDKDKDAIKNQLEMFVEHINPQSSQEDILYELLLKSGFPLSTKIAQLSFADKTVFSIDEGAMLICLEKDLTPEVIKAMAHKNPVRVICLDEGFHGNDQLKTNAVQIMKSKDINFRTV